MNTRIYPLCMHIQTHTQLIYSVFTFLYYFYSVLFLIILLLCSFYSIGSAASLGEELLCLCVVLSVLERSSTVILLFSVCLRGAALSLCGCQCAGEELLCQGGCISAGSALLSNECLFTRRPRSPPFPVEYMSSSSPALQLPFWFCSVLCAESRKAVSVGSRADRSDSAG